MPAQRKTIAEWCVGVCLALVLQTNYRLFGGIGLGEIGLAIFVILAPLIRGPVGDQRQSRTTAFANGFLLYVPLCLLPSTMLTVFGLRAGSIDPEHAWRDFLAYGLGALFVWCMGTRRFEIGTCARVFAVSTLLLTTLQYGLGGAEAWYGMRFTGGAKNPNQLALYCICGMTVAAAHGFPTQRLVLMFGFAVTGLLCRSDAFVLTVAGIVALFLTASCVPPRYAWVGVTVIGTLIGGAAMSSGSLPEGWGERWAEADQGGSRWTLLLNGLSAWRQSWWTVVLGNGSGAFSGKLYPFEGDEAHNTVVDTLAIGGLVGLVVLFWYPIRVTAAAYGGGRPILFATMAGLLAFSCFHYVGRHPVFWFAVMAVGAKVSPESGAFRPVAQDRWRLPLSSRSRRLGVC